MPDESSTMHDALYEQDKRRIVDRLRSAGWAMADGAVILDRAALVYENDQMVIEVTQDHRVRELLLTPDQSSW